MFFLVTQAEWKNGCAGRCSGFWFWADLQGAVGWWMVASGLVDRVDVSQYRLATHLTLACLIFRGHRLGDARAGSPLLRSGSKSRVKRGAGALSAGLILVQIYLGGLVAGLDAGLASSTHGR
jgi:cytochrome c oxidase assembly protein subunit 15